MLRVVTLNSEDGTALIGATVVLAEPGADGAPEMYCVSDRDGMCDIRNIPDGVELELRVTYIGYQVHTELLTFGPGERKIVRVVMKTDIGEIGELIVSRERYLTTGEVGVHRISSTQISRIPSPVAGGDLATFLQSVPGVITSGDRGGDLYIRGGTPDQNLILVDNMPIVKPFHISNLFSAFPDDMVQNADIYAGGFSPRYSDATSAVIDIALRPGNMRQFRSSASVSPYLVAFQAEGPIETDRSSFLINGRYSVISHTAPLLTGEDQKIQFADLTGRYTIQGDKMNCSITGIYTHDSGEIVPLRNIEHTWSNIGVGARCLGFSENFSHPIAVSAGYAGYQNEEGNVDLLERYSQLNQIFVNMNMTQQVGILPVDMGFGVNLKTYRIELNDRFARFLSIDNEERRLPLVHYFAAAEWSVGNRFTIYPGFTSQFSLDMPMTFEPRIRLAFQPGDDSRSQISVAAGRYVQTHSGISDERDAGTVFMVYKPFDIDDPLPSAYHGLLGYHQRIGNSVSIHAETFVKQHYNIPVSKWNPEPQIEIETALADGLTYGFDLKFSLEKTLYYATVSYGWMLSEYEAVSEDLGAWVLEPVFGYSPAHDQRHKLNITGGYQLSSFRLNARWEFGSGMPYTEIYGFDFSFRFPDENPNTEPGTARVLFNEPYGERMPWYHRLDVSLSRDIELGGSKLETQAGVINVYDRRNIFNFDYGTLQRVDQSPFLPYLSLRLVI